MSDFSAIAPENVFIAPYPFVREKYVRVTPNPDEPERDTWRPGVRFEPVPPDDGEAVADAVGNIILTVVGRFKPGRFPERVFYTRQWESPDGAKFGKNNLRIATLAQFKRLALGYRHEYRLISSGTP